MDITNNFSSTLEELEENKNINQTSNIKTENKKGEKKLMVDFFGVDLVKQCKEGLLDPVIGREKEIYQVIYTLLRKNKNNPLLIGEAGVGKSAIVEGLAWKIVKGEVPDKLKNKRIVSLDMGALLSGTSLRGDFERRVKTIFEEVMNPENNIILFIDEIHNIVGAGNAMDTNDFAQLVKPMLARGKMMLIGATTFEEYRKHIEKDAALKRRFQEIIVDEPTPEVTKEILLGLKGVYEDFHGVIITEDAIDAAIRLSRRYILDKHLPDKAIDLIDEACARKKVEFSSGNREVSINTLKNEEEKIKKEINELRIKIEDAIMNQDYFLAAQLKDKINDLLMKLKKESQKSSIPQFMRPEVKAEDIGNVLADKLGIPEKIVNETELEKLKRLGTVLREKVLGQEEAVEAVIKTLVKSRLSAVDKKGPMGSFLFLGPSGCGKTYLAKVIAKEYFGDEKALIRFDMSEFMEKYSVSRLIGSPAGYVGYDDGGHLTEEVRKRPYSVVLFDEIEKAAPEVLNILLHVLDEGYLKDSRGHIVSFRSTIIILTSNFASEEFMKKKVKIGFDMPEQKSKDEWGNVKERIKEEIKKFLTPELLNRLDYIVVFNPLDKKVLKNIFKKQLEEFYDMWKRRNPGIKLPKITDKKLDIIIDEIYDPALGARPIRRYIEQKIEAQIVEGILNGKN